MTATERFLAWGRLWSPLCAEEEHQAAWQALELPGRFEDIRLDYWNSFHAGIPQPEAPLLLHALLQREGAALREDLLRVADYLELEWSAHRLPPDHLGPVCELFAVAGEREEAVLRQGLCSRYLRPWVEAALARLADGPLDALLRRFRADLDELG